ncbi:hypothetical protein MYRA21_1776 [Myroides sp. A21]|uniref:hypothetical protein n=1 Tax=Myroides TaxID=76831 RepID=UPI000585FAF1|nr:MULTISPECIES: hypothetical protein [Myroides]AJA68926.1 hypothetical protein MYRA21_1776 [Myroides sp. A21]MEC4034327.1 hypothetical protein [Myroides odoratimimus]
MKNFFYFILFNVGCFAQQKEAIELYVSEKGTRLFLDYKNEEYAYSSHSDVLKLDIHTLINPIEAYGSFKRVDDKIIQLNNEQPARIRDLVKDYFKVSFTNKGELVKDKIEVNLTIKKGYYEEYFEDPSKYNSHQESKYIITLCSEKYLVSDFDKARGTSGCIVLREGMNILSSGDYGRLRGEFYLKVYPNFYNPVNREGTVYAASILSPKFKFHKSIDIELDLDPLMFCVANFDGDYIRVISDTILEFRGERLFLNKDAKVKIDKEGGINYYYY